MPTAPPMTPAQMLAALHAEGLTPVENQTPDWRTHDRNHIAAWGPVAGVAIHHTAGTNSLAFCINGDAGLPGPLCHAHIAKDGTLTLISGGRANHFGGMAQNAYDAMVAQSPVHPAPGGAEPIDGNAVTYGIEIENLGNGTDPYPTVQYETAVKWATAICRRHGWTADAVIGHGEGTTRKIDPSFPMADFRAAVTARLETSAMPLSYVEVRDTALKANQTPAVGYYLFVPSGRITNGTTSQTTDPVRADIDEDGQIVARLAAGDDPATEPEGLTYTVIRRTRHIENGPLVADPPYSIEVNAADAAAGIDLAERAHVDVMPEFIQYALTVAGVEPNPATGDVPLTPATIGALTQALADQRYLLQTGGTVTGTVTTKRANATDSLLAGIVGVEAFDRVRVLANGTLEVGPGTGARDVNWRRSAANEWTTDDSVVIALALRHLGTTLGFYGAAAATKPTVTGSTGGNAALTSLLSALATLGLITNSTTA
ncbi:N-acetylmuramoyl-L-alanine amidase [Streptomyces hirsutus]|uniref:N-acetylmuramoyl-L-alanine amidase n=1 Tax=Streptomyces hirsutus TaxID=35620 RepID=UPI00332E3805